MILMLLDYVLWPCINIGQYPIIFCHQDLDNLREAPRNIIWDEVKVMTFKSNLSCFCKKNKNI